MATPQNNVIIACTNEAEKAALEKVLGIIRARFPSRSDASAILSLYEDAKKLLDEKISGEGLSGSHSSYHRNHSKQRSTDVSSPGVRHQDSEQELCFHKSSSKRHDTVHLIFQAEKSEKKDHEGEKSPHQKRSAAERSSRRSVSRPLDPIHSEARLSSPRGAPLEPYPPLSQAGAKVDSSSTPTVPEGTAVEPEPSEKPKDTMPSPKVISTNGSDNIYAEAMGIIDNVLMKKSETDMLANAHVKSTGDLASEINDLLLEVLTLNDEDNGSSKVSPQPSSSPTPSVAPLQLNKQEKSNPASERRASGGSQDSMDNGLASPNSSSVNHKRSSRNFGRDTPGSVVKVHEPTESTSEKRKSTNLSPYKPPSDDAKVTSFASPLPPIGEIKDMESSKSDLLVNEQDKPQPTVPPASTTPRSLEKSSVSIDRLAIPPISSPEPQTPNSNNSEFISPRGEKKGKDMDIKAPVNHGGTSDIMEQMARQAEQVRLMIEKSKRHSITIAQPRVRSSSNVPGPAALLSPDSKTPKGAPNSSRRSMAVTSTEMASINDAEINVAVEEQFDAMLVNSDSLKLFRKWIESQNMTISTGVLNNLQFVSDVIQVKRKPGDVSSACSKVASKYLVADAPYLVQCDHSKLDAFRTLYNLFGAQSPGVFDDILVIVRPSLIALWLKYPNRNPVSTTSVDVTPTKNVEGASDTASPRIPTPVKTSASKSDSKHKPTASVGEVLGNLIKKKPGTPDKDKDSKDSKDKDKGSGRKNRNHPKDKTKFQDDTMASIIIEKVDVNSDDVSGTCGLCGKAVMNSVEGLRFGMQVYHNGCLKCRVCTKVVPPEDGKAPWQNRNANQAICKDCS